MTTIERVRCRQDSIASQDEALLVYLVNLLYASGSINGLKQSADYLDTDVK